VSPKKRIIKKSLVRSFPALRSGAFQVKSRKTSQYNCIAWAAGNNERWWDPSPGYYWPITARQGTLEELIAYFKSLGFTEAAAEESEAGVAKIAIYEVGGDYTHAAKQLGNGKWSSKLGSSEDIEHESLASLEGDKPAYGKIAVVLKQPS
jgi:hypothetical protein